VHEPTGSIAVAWINDSGALKVSVNPQPGTCIEQENGGLGWTPPVTLESANASDVGLAFLADGTLFVCYDLSGAKKFRTNKLLGMGTLSDWTAAATPSPSVSRHSDQGRAQRQAFRFRATGGTPNPWQGSGNIEFSQARLNTDAWTSPITIVTGSRGIFAGGSWIGQGYGCLYTRESDGLVYWKTTDNPDVWPAGFGTQIAEISLMPISLARHPSGSLCAITWDATGTTKCRAAYSHGRGEAWEESAADIPVIPPLTQPPMIVCSGGNFYAIWVANDQVMCAFSTDGGVTWAG
jgi:hypothetical protein